MIKSLEIVYNDEWMFYKNKTNKKTQQKTSHTYNIFFSRHPIQNV